MKKFFGSTRRKNSQSADSSSPYEAKASQSSNFLSDKASSRTSLHKVTSPPSSAVPPSATAPALSTPTGAGGSLVDAVSKDVAGGLSNSNSSSGPRPSELFAGKGVQWGQIDLTARDLTQPVDTNRPVDMQKFLKERTDKAHPNAYRTAASE